MGMRALLVLLAVALAGCSSNELQPPPQTPAAPPAEARPPATVEVKPPAKESGDLEREKATALAHALTVEPLKTLPEDGRVTIRARLKNPTAGELKPVVTWDATGTWWQGEKAVAMPIPAGGEGVIEIRAKVGQRLFPLPRAKIELADGSRKLFSWPFLAEATAGIGPVVREWNVVGPFELGLVDKTGAERDDRDRYLKGRLPGWDGLLAPEQGVDLGQSYPGKGGRTVRWEPLKADPEGLVDLKAHYDTGYAVACAVSYIHSPKGGRHDFTCGSAASIRVSINGKEAWKKHADRAAVRDQDFFSADLKPGWNEVLLKVATRAAGWGFYFRVIDPDRTLKFALRPAAGETP